MRYRIRASAIGLLLNAWSLSPVIAADAPVVSTPLPATFDLVTEREATAWKTTPSKEPTDFATRDLGLDGGTPTCSSASNNDADNPRIKIVEPVLEKPLLAPVDIDLQFVQAGSAHIRPDTFRVCYLGLMTMDITKRITDRITVSEKGLHISGAQLPHGHHRLLLMVADERGRLARREAVFNVL